MIRLSGVAAFEVARSLVRCPGSPPWDSHRILYGHVLDASGEGRLDEVLVLLCGATKFHREDVAEIHCHGGVIVAQQVLERVLDRGVRRALPGEFSAACSMDGRPDPC